jgi:hypothetical protein
MKTTYARRYRRPAARSREAGIAKKNNLPEHAFFAAPSSESFFKPNMAIQRKCAHCEAEDNKVGRQSDIKEEEKKVQKVEEKKEEESIQKLEDKKEEKEVHKQDEEKKEEKEVHKVAGKKEKQGVQKMGDKEEEKTVQKLAEPKEEEKKIQKAADKQEEKPLHRKADNTEEEKKLDKKERTASHNNAAAASAYIHSLDGKGTSLPEETLQFFSKRMGYDFSEVKIHTGTEAEQSAKSVNAKAYAVDNHIVFNKGQYNPGSEEGKKLLAHELTHIVQNKKAESLERKTGTVEEEKDKTIVFTGTGTNTENKIAHGGCAGVMVQGQTIANRTSSFTSTIRARPSTTCENCAPPECITARGTIASVFRANPKVTLPAVPAGLSRCEATAVRRFIRTTLRRHEQQHVAAFNTYDARIRTPYRFTGCESGLAAHIQSLHDAIDAQRVAASDARSNALDPFAPTIPCNCD